MTNEDLISRAAAIDAINKPYDVSFCELPLGNRSYSDIAKCLMIAYDKGKEDAIKHIQDLPPAQPERTCVNCGRTANNGGWYADGGTRCPIEEHYALPKDGYCYLWEKRNVTDDNYPERREE